ncbi:MAG: hypothetical protein HYY61_03320 [Deltaproteobacteria bacterium]|nr:hypothetical protein [Deltaproteobacteria bacterium]
MSQPIVFDFTHLMNHFSDVQLHTLFKKREVAKQTLKQKRQNKELGFLDLPYQTNILDLKKSAQKIKNTCETLLVIGIGGSSLGTKAALQALGTHSNTQVLFLENPNPATLEQTLKNSDLKKTALNVISKSGTTLETLSLFFIVFEKLRKTIPEKQLKEKVWITTEGSPTQLKENFLYQIAQEYSLPVLPIPQNVPGRYSVLSPVGLLPLLVAGIDIEEMLEGAASSDQNSRESYLYGTLAYGAHQLLKKPLTVFFPYDERLSLLGDWFCQLWAESLAKSESSGPTPLKAVGALDQHSLLQLFLQGPQDKWYTLLTLEDYQSSLSIPQTKLLKEFSYLANTPLEKVLQAEQKATEASLIQFENPVCRLTLPSLSAYSLGALFYHFELATSIAGYLYEINPFDQPAVEQGKILTQKLLKGEGLDF